MKTKQTKFQVLEDASGKYTALYDKITDELYVPATTGLIRILALTDGIAEANYENQSYLPISWLIKNDTPYAHLWKKLEKAIRTNPGFIHIFS